MGDQGGTPKFPPRSMQLILFLQNGTWNGLMADLVNQKADMCVTALKINSDRQRDIDFSIPFHETGIAILVALRRGALSPTAFLRAYDSKFLIS